MRVRYKFTLQRARKYLKLAIAFELFLVIVFLSVKQLEVANRVVQFLFNLNGEYNIPAFFSAAQLFLVGRIFISINKENKASTFIPTSLFSVLGFGFIYLSIDEAFHLHENMSGLLRNAEWIPKFYGGHGVWVLPYFLIGLVCFLYYSKILLKIWRKYPKELSIIVSGFTIYLLAVLGLEIINLLFILGKPVTQFVYLTEVSVEEFLEMISITIVLYGAVWLRQSLTEKQTENIVT